MKQKFLKLVEKVKDTDIVKELIETTDADNFKIVWRSFLDENQELVERIHDWASEYKKNDELVIFKKGEIIENPVEIAIIIRIIDDSCVTECEIFESCGELADAIEDIDGDIFKDVSNIIRAEMIYNIMPQDIFYSDD